MDGLWKANDGIDIAGESLKDTNDDEFHTMSKKGIIK